MSDKSNLYPWTDPPKPKEIQVGDVVFMINLKSYSIEPMRYEKTISVSLNIGRNYVNSFNHLITNEQITLTMGVQKNTLARYDCEEVFPALDFQFRGFIKSITFNAMLFTTEQKAKDYLKNQIIPFYKAVENKHAQSAQETFLKCIDKLNELDKIEKSLE